MTNLLWLFVIIAFVSLIVVSAANERQSRARIVARKLEQMKRKLSEMEELVLTVDTLVESPTIARILNDEVVDVIRSMVKLDPNSQAIRVTLEASEDRAESLRAPNRKRDVYRLRESDARVARARYLLNEAGRILRHRQAKGKIEVSELETYIRDLSWANMMVAVVSQVAQGHKSVSRGDVLKAFAFYKKAQQIAVQTSIGEDRRHNLIKELTDLMNGRIKVLSPQFMPENQFNPSPSSKPAASDTTAPASEPL
ncbi:hypothetical protein [Teredinibacter waterburyi]|jgi:hypothetical protein|uniref:hypothetical protein n=1 Tax=Teredinibacter waterburyi TaxID=1500538 RepID=UPI001FE4F5A0|nr:hypothetical protein [Teredinibacter waterburyi]